MKPATSNLACSWGLLRPITKSDQKKSRCGPVLGELPEIWGFPFNVSATVEASNFKFGMQLKFAKPIIKSHPKVKVGVALRYDSSPKFGGSPMIFLQRLGLETLQFGAQVGFAKAHHKITRNRKGGHGPGLGELPKIRGSASIFTQWLKLVISN